MPELFAEMRQDLSESPFIREFITMRKGWLYNSDPNNPIFSYNFDDHENLTGKLTVLENHGLVTEITYNNAKRYTMSEEFVGLPYCTEPTLGCAEAPALRTGNPSCAET